MSLEKLNRAIERSETVGIVQIELILVPELRNVIGRRPDAPGPRVQRAPAEVARMRAAVQPVHDKFGASYDPAVMTLFKSELERVSSERDRRKLRRTIEHLAKKVGEPEGG